MNTKDIILHPAWTKYYNMVQRCYNPKIAKYKDYGGRGIDICKEWNEDFELFAKWLETQGWTEPNGMHLDRINNDLGYSPSNCRIVTPKENMRNRRSCSFYMYKNKRLCLEEIFELPECPDISRCVLSKRLRKGLSVEEAIATPAGSQFLRHSAFGEEKRLYEWAKDKRCKVSKGVIKSRVNMGWDFEKALTTKVTKSKHIKMLGKTQSIYKWSKELGIKESTIWSRFYRGQLSLEATEEQVGSLLSLKNI